MSEALQDRFAPNNRCFGCGPANEKGLRLKSIVGPDAIEIVCHFTPEPHHLAFGDVLNGGIIGALLDCHSNWTAAYHLMRAQALELPPCTVTADFHVTLKRPTPMDVEVILRARPERIEGDRVIVEAVFEARGKLTATCRGSFVAVKEGHPAFHRW
ncbi:MAG: PaaI family thioesterase [Myxococcales bacterium]|nr:PaaI family thioesterase [Myxococcales bacterium]